MVSDYIPVSQQKLEYLLLLLLIIGSLNFLMISADLSGYQFDIDYSEGFIIEDTSRLIDSGELYLEPSLDNGFESVKYPPLYFIILGVIGSIANLGFLTGRIINLIALGGIFCLIYLFMKERNISSNFIPLIFLIPYLTAFTGLTLRTDILALFFSFTGIYLFEKKQIYGAALALIFAFLTKQIFIAGFGAVNLYLLLQIDFSKIIQQLKQQDFEKIVKENMDIWKFNIAYVVGLSVSIIAIQIWSPYFLQNTLFANIGGFNLRWELLTWAHFVFLPIFSLASYYIYISRDWMLGSYFFLSIATMILQMTRGGAWIHPTLQPFLASVVCVSMLYSRFEIVRKPVTALLILQTLIFFAAPMVSGNIFDVSQMDDRNQGADSEILRQVENSESNVFVEHIGYELEAGDNPSPEIWGIYEQQSAEKLSNDEVTEFFRQQNYTKIITYKRIDNLGIDDYIREKYEVTDRYERYDMLLNKENWRVYEWTG